MLPIEQLLPLRAIDITLQFTDIAHIRLFHQPALTAWLRHLVGEIPGYEQYLTLDAPESGRVDYQAGDYYRFSLITLAGGEHLLQVILDRLMALPHSVKRDDTQMPFRDNLIFHSAYDLFPARPIKHVEELTPYTWDALQQEVERWQFQEYCQLRWLAPVRLLLPNQPPENRKGEMRFCRHRSQLDFALLNNRLYDSLAELLRQRGSEVPPRQTDETPRVQAADLFWVDYSYRDAQGKEKPMGGLLGRLTLVTTAMPVTQWLYWVLGQYLGIGQRRAFGWGRYQLETMTGEYTMVRSSAASTLMMLTSTEANLQAAYAALHDNPVVTEVEEEDDADLPVDRLARLGEQLLRGEYEIPALREQTLLKADGTNRWLQVPPFFDRVAQRAVAQILTPALDTLMYSGSFGFRRGRSRHTACRMIQAAYQAGYRWVFESDVDDFFDNIQWARLYTRLTAFFGDDPIVDLVMRWMSAPLNRSDHNVERQIGLPQGSPLSPLLANIMLDDFDSDLEQAGLKLVRFADDFVVLCRTQAEATAVAEIATAALAEVGLQLNQQKTAVRSFAQGFRYLGYLFVNDLALDVGGEKAPLLMSSQSPSRTAVTSTPQPQVIRVGEMAASGTVVFVSGTPAVVTTLEEQLRVMPVTEDDSAHSTEPLVSLPWRQIQAVVLFGAQQITTPALRAALQAGVTIHFADSGGHYQGCTWSGATEEQQLWLAQVTWFSHPDNVLPAAQRLVIARLRHQREVLRQRNLQHRFDESLQRLERLANQSSQAIDLASLRGFEGQGAKCYFEALQSLLPTWVDFDGRQRRPPPDPFNALLSLGYTILYAHVETVIRVGGLLPWVGFYHQPHGHHAVLVSDLIEPFRHLVERVALNALSKQQLTAADFVMTETQGCRLRDEARRRYLTLLSERFETPFRGQQLETAEKLHQHLYWQVQMVKLWIRGQQAQFSAWRLH
jgi:group II intron reverse transcriptase/maturase/CRISPR-associated endonuclease Cas1